MKSTHILIIAISVVIICILIIVSYFVIKNILKNKNYETFTFKAREVNCKSNILCRLGIINPNKITVKTLKMDNAKQAAVMLAKINNDIVTLNTYIGKMYGNYSQDRINEIVENLSEKYHSDVLIEVDPNNKEGDTSFTIKKGKEVHLCLRDKNYNLYDYSTVLFVALHELSHIAIKEYGHNDKFWETFKFILQNANRINLLEMIDYSKYPIQYSVLEVNHNPYFDDSIINLM